MFLSRMIPQNDTDSSPWVKSPVPTLYKYKPSGMYYLRTKIKGRLVRVSLKTTSFAVAKSLKGKTHDEERAQIEAEAAGPASVAMLADEWLAIQSASREIKASTKKVYVKTWGFIQRTWPALAKMNAWEVKDEACKKWLRAILADEYSSDRHNSASILLRSVFKHGLARGALAKNPMEDIAFLAKPKKPVKLPSPDEFKKLFQWLGKNASCQAFDLFQALAFTGMRISEAQTITPDMVNLARNEIRLPGSMTKNGEPRSVPIIADVVPVIKRLLDEYPGEGPLIVGRDIRWILARAFKELGISRFTHHDLRHLFITRCIESGVDVKTVASWVGHQDGGVLILKTYAHLRSEHSQQMAEKVKFS